MKLLQEIEIPFVLDDIILKLVQEYHHYNMQMDRPYRSQSNLKDCKLRWNRLCDQLKEVLDVPS